MKKKFKISPSITSPSDFSFNCEYNKDIFQRWLMMKGWGYEEDIVTCHAFHVPCRPDSVATSSALVLLFCHLSRICSYHMKLSHGTDVLWTMLVILVHALCEVKWVINIGWGLLNQLCKFKFVTIPCECLSQQPSRAPQRHHQIEIPLIDHIQQDHPVHFGRNLLTGHQRADIRMSRPTSKPPIYPAQSSHPPRSLFTPPYPSGHPHSTLSFTNDSGPQIPPNTPKILLPYTLNSLWLPSPHAHCFCPLCSPCRTMMQENSTNEGKQGVLSGQSSFVWRLRTLRSQVLVLVS